MSIFKFSALHCYRMELALLLMLAMSAPLQGSPPIVIGLDADMSAGAREGGEAIRRGALLAVEDINRRGGVLGRPLQLLVRDHRGNPARGIDNIKYFAGLEDLVAVLGGVHTPVAIEELPYIHQHRIIYLGPWAAGTPIIDNGYQPNFVFRISIRDEEAGKVLVEHAYQRGLSRLGLLLERTSWGRSNQRSLLKAAAEADAEIVASQWFNWGQGDMQREVSALLEAGAEAIVLVANAPEGALIARAMLGLPASRRVPLISHWGIAAGDFVRLVGQDSLAQLDLTVLQTYSFSRPRNKELNQQVISEYQRRFSGEDKLLFAPVAAGTAHAYDLVQLLAHAIASANSADRNQVRLALEQLRQHQGLLKNYRPAFSTSRHDALWAEDYIMSRFDAAGFLVPQEDSDR